MNEPTELTQKKERAQMVLIAPQAALNACQQNNVRITGVSDYVLLQMTSESDPEITLISIA